MARTKAEIRAFLDSQVGHTCVDKSDARYNGQCVCLIKVLMDFLGVPNPYIGRGNANTAGNAYINQGIGTNGRGWLTIVVNKDMGRLFVDGRWQTFGHIWVDLMNEANYESNGARALITTKNTRPYSQGQQFINFDKWVKNEGDGQMIIQNAENWYQRCNKTHLLIRGRALERSTFNGFVGQEFLRFVEICSDDKEADAVQAWQELGKLASKDKWQQQIYDLQAAIKGRPTPEQLAQAQKQATELKAQVDGATKKAEAAEKRASELEVAHIEAEKAGSAFTLWLGGILSKITGGK